MPVASNRYYNDPALGQAFANLADAFAPPSGSDASGYATAAATKANAARLADLFSYAKGPQYDQALADRMATAAGVYAPTSSYYAVNTGDATARRGQDIAANTSITNNKNTVLGSTLADLYGALNEGQVRPAVPADLAATIGLPAVPAAAGNAKPLSADEVKAQQLQWLFDNANDPTAATRSAVTGAQQYGDTQPGFAQTNETNRKGQELDAIAKLYGPLSQGQVRPAIPADVASHVGLPEITQALGLDKPLSETEVKGGIISDLPVKDQMDMVLSDIPVEKVGPEGRFARRSDAVGQTATPSTPQTVVNMGPNGVDYGKPADGLVWARNTDGTVKLDDRGAPIGIPYQGGPEWAKQEAAKKAAEAKGSAASTTADIVVQDIDRAMGIINENPELATGLGNQTTGWLANTPGFNLNEMLQSVKAAIGFDKLQAMRDSSPTGGALGQVTEKEMGLLQSAYGSLATAQDDTTLKDNLKRVKNIYLDIIHGPGAGPPRELLSFEQGDASGGADAPAAEAPMTATNPTTGEKLKLVNGQWVPM